MKYLKKYNEGFFDFLKKKPIADKKSNVAEICDKYSIWNWSLNSDGTVDVDDFVDLERKKLTKLPLNFGRVEYYFDCDNNKLTSLEGCPKYVGGNFRCSRNLLTSLEGCPKYVGGGFYSDDSKLTSLVGCPQYIDGEFYCQDNNIKSLEGIGHIGGRFECYGNPIYVIWILFRDTSKIDMFNEWGVIQNNQVILYRLNDFLQEIGKDDVTEQQLNWIKKFYTVL